MQGSHCNCYAEPLFYREMARVINWTASRLAPAPTFFFFGFDELHGINRDSRSARAGRSNAGAVAHAMNTLQASVPVVRSLAQPYYVQC